MFTCSSFCAGNTAAPGGYFLVKGYWRFAAGGVVFSLGNWVDYNGVTF